MLSASIVEKDADGAVAMTARLERIHLGGVEAENEEDANRMK